MHRFFRAVILLQSAIWQCLNNYDYADAVFLSERLYAEGETVFLILNLFNISFNFIQCIALLCICSRVTGRHLAHKKPLPLVSNGSFLVEQLW